MCCLCLTSPEAGGWWNTKGCEVVSKQHRYTVCYCNHTTNFALLLQVYEAEVTFLSPMIPVCFVQAFIHRMCCYLQLMLCMCVCLCVCVSGAQRTKKLCRCWRSSAVECLCVASSSPSSSSSLWGESQTSQSALCKAHRVKSLSKNPARFTSINGKNRILCSVDMSTAP